MQCTLGISVGPGRDGLLWKVNGKPIGTAAQMAAPARGDPAGDGDAGQQVRALRAAAALAALSFAACSDSEPTPAEQQAPRPAKPTPIACLEAAGMEDIEKRAPGLWRGRNPGAATLVLIERFPTKAGARLAARQATLITRFAVGRYHVRGPFPKADTGSTAAVADCMRGK